MNGTAGHKATMHDKHKHDGVHGQNRVLKPDTTRQVVVDPPAVHPVCHHGVQSQRCRDRRALEVLRFSGSILGDHSGGDVEARKASQPTEHEEGEQDVVGGRTQADGEGHHCGGEAEGDLLQYSLVGIMEILDGRQEKGKSAY